MGKFGLISGPEFQELEDLFLQLVREDSPQLCDWELQNLRVSPIKGLEARKKFALFSNLNSFHFVTGLTKLPSVTSKS